MTINFIHRGNEVLITVEIDGKVESIEIPYDEFQAMAFNMKAGARVPYQWPMGDTACIKGVASITDIFVELREARSLLREMEHIRDIWWQDYEQLVQVAELYVDAFGDDEMLTAAEALRLTMVRDAIARWRNR